MPPRFKMQDDLIKEFRQELKKKDEEYEALKQQKEDINQLLERMRQSSRNCRASTKLNWRRSRTLLAERDELLNKNREEIDALYEKRKEAELKFLEN